MGDRSNCTFSIPLAWIERSHDRRLATIATCLAGEVSLDQLRSAFTAVRTWNVGLDRWQNGSVWLTVQCEEVGGGGYEQSGSLIAAHVPFLHDWSAGDEYTTGEGASTGRRHEEVATVGGDPVVCVNRATGRVNPRQLDAARTYGRIHRAVVRMGLRGASLEAASLAA